LLIVDCDAGISSALSVFIQQSKIINQQSNLTSDQV